MLPDVQSVWYFSTIIQLDILLKLTFENAIGFKYKQIIFDILIRLLPKPQAVKARAPLWTP